MDWNNFNVNGIGINNIFYFRYINIYSIYIFIHQNNMYFSLSFYKNYLDKYFINGFYQIKYSLCNDIWSFNIWIDVYNLNSYIVFIAIKRFYYKLLCYYSKIT